MRMHEGTVAGEGNIKVLSCQSECGQGLTQILLVPFENILIPPQVEAFPLAQVVYYNKGYICLRFDLGSFDIVNQRSFPNLGEAIDWGQAHAKAWFIDLMGSGIGQKRGRKSALVGARAAARSVTSRAN
jgi:hypothetical protein